MLVNRVKLRSPSDVSVIQHVPRKLDPYQRHFFCGIAKSYGMLCSLFNGYSFVICTWVYIDFSLTLTVGIKF